MIPFTAHNIELAGGRRTIPGQILLREDPGFQAIARALTTIHPAAPGRRPTVVDLGCLEGGYSVEMARMGYEVLGIEARKESFERCEMLRRELSLPGLRFAHDDARNVARYGEFDVVFCNGLLYHLEKPVEYLMTLGRLCRHLLLLGTHFAAETEAGKFHLSPMTVNEGRRGRWYEEFPEGTASDEVEKLPWASWGNPRSFWLEKSELLQAIQDAGFPLVLEQYDILGSVREYLRHLPDYHRGLFLGVKV